MALDKLEKQENIIGEKVYDLGRFENYKVEIKINEKVPTGLFLPDKIIPNTWYANLQTFKALNKNIFTGETILDEYILQTPCPQCKNKLDWQYWLHCPYCEFKPSF